MKKVILFLFALYLLFLPALVIAEGISTDLPTEPFTWAYLVTIGGATVAVLLIVQLCKFPLDKIWKIPTRAVVYFIALVILLLATYFTAGLTVESGILTALNAVIVALGAMGLYELTFKRKDDARKAAEAEILEDE